MQKKNPAAVALGRLGAAKGGRARAEKLTPEQRSESARRAVQARWARASSRPNTKNTAVAPVRPGARKGGLARAAKLTAEQRSESARRAVQARWARTSKDGK